ncbi:hypothetical protein, partial [Pseudomonas aeruginosa]
MKQESKRWLSRALIVAALLGVGVLVWQVSRPTGLGGALLALALG